jgi:hypothetical protein
MKKKDKKPQIPEMGKLEQLIPDFVKKIARTGFDALFFTEDNLRHLVREFKLPKEVVGSLLNEARYRKEEIIGKLLGEVTKVVKRIDIAQELKKAMTGLEIEIKTQIQFKPKRQADS